MKPILLDGSTGGGQMLRTALTLALASGRPFHIKNIRGKRQKPGLMRQHLTCVRAACEISGGSVDGAEVGSTEIIFRSGSVRPSHYDFSIGTAGSTGLLFQTLFPALALAGGESSLRLSGGTHNPLAPSFDFLDRVFLPAARKMGFDATIILKQTGFAPAGGGLIEAVIRPAGNLTPLVLTDRGPLVSSRVRVPVRGIAGVGERILTATLEHFPCDDARIDALPPGPGQGVCCIVESVFEHVVEMTCTPGEINVSSESVGKRAGKAMAHFHESGAPVGRYLADQLLLPMALAGGGNFLTLTPDDHVPANISVIESFLPVKFLVARANAGLWHISCR